MFHLNVGGGLELRLLEERHAEEIFQATDRNRELMRQWLPWVDRTHSAEQPREFILNSMNDYMRGQSLNAGIFDRGALVGAIGIHKIDMVNHSTSIGYWLDRASQGTGIMTRACRAMVTHAFAGYRLHRIEIRCATGNLKSCAIPQRLGFVREGVAREAEWVSGRYLDLVIWSMLARDWRE